MALFKRPPQPSLLRRWGGAAILSVFLVAATAAQHWGRLDTEALSSSPAYGGRLLEVEHNWGSNLATTGVSVTTISIEPALSFKYAYLSKDKGSSQVKNVRVRALEPGLTGLWVNGTRACCAKGGHVIDVGAHFGYYSLLSYALGCDFTAFEPVPQFASVMRRGMALNHVQGRSQLVEAAAGLAEGKVKMLMPKWGVLGEARIQRSAYKSKRPRLATLEVTMTTLDAKLPQPRLKLGTICALKIDVEGYEPDVVKGGMNVIGRTQPPYILLEMSPGLHKPGLKEMLWLLHEHGYQAIEVSWALAKAERQPSEVELSLFEALPILDISTPEARKALVDRVEKRVSTNLWFTYVGQTASAS